MNNRELFFWTLGFILFGFALAFVTQSVFVLRPEGQAVEHACATGALERCLIGRQSLINVYGVMIGALTLLAVVFGFWQSRETQMAEFRPYFRIEIGSVSLKYGRAIVEIKFVNYGRTTARRVYGMIEAFIVPYDGTTGEGPMSATFDLHDIPSDKPMIIKLGCPNLEAEFGSGNCAWVEAGLAGLKIQGLVRYRDTFNRWHDERFFEEFSQNLTSATDDLRRVDLPKPYHGKIHF